MKILLTSILTILIINRVCIAQDTLYIYKGGEVVGMRAVADIDSITFYKLGSTVTDIEGNVYKTVKIGSQIWMAENLKTRKFNDSTSILLVTDQTEWAGFISPGYCCYNNDSTTYNATYGVLYNWYAVNTGKLCPIGWHVPTDSEWTVLTDFLGGEEIAGGKLKEAGFAHWSDPNTDATNESGFTALPGGYRFIEGDFLFNGDIGSWWSSTELRPSNAWNRIMLAFESDANRTDNGKQDGLSVRCIKDD